MPDDRCPISNEVVSSSQFIVHAVWAWTCCVFKIGTNDIAQAHTQPMHFSISFGVSFPGLLAHGVHVCQRSRHDGTCCT